MKVLLSIDLTVFELLLLVHNLVEQGTLMWRPSKYGLLLVHHHLLDTLFDSGKLCIMLHGCLLGVHEGSIFCLMLAQNLR